MSRQPNQVGSSGVGGGAGVVDGQPQHQPMQDTAGTDQQFVLLRTSMREKIFEYISRRQSSAEWRRRLPELAKRLEEILYRKFPNKNDYYDMMKGPFQPQLRFAIKTLSAQNQHNQVDSSGVGGGAGVVDGRPQHQPMQDFAGTDQQFVLLRISMREKIFEYIGRRQSPDQWRRLFPELAKRLERILYRKFRNKNDYYNMMKGPLEPQLLFAVKTLSAQNQQMLRHGDSNPWYDARHQWKY